MKRLAKESGTGPGLGTHPDPLPDPGTSVANARSAQAKWVGVGITERQRVIRDFRRGLVEGVGELSESLGRLTDRLPCEVLAFEVLPLVDACRFLERSAEKILRTRKAGWFGRPLWLWGAASEVCREPFGVVLAAAGWRRGEI